MYGTWYPFDAVDVLVTSECPGTFPLIPKIPRVESVWAFCVVILFAMLTIHVCIFRACFLVWLQKGDACPKLEIPPPDMTKTQQTYSTFCPRQRDPFFSHSQHWNHRSFERGSRATKGAFAASRQRKKRRSCNEKAMSWMTRSGEQKRWGRGFCTDHRERKFQGEW